MRAAGNQELGLLCRAENPLGSLVLVLCDLRPATPGLRDLAGSVAMEGDRPTSTPGTMALAGCKLESWGLHGHHRARGGGGGEQASGILRKHWVGGARCLEGTRASLRGFWDGAVRARPGGAHAGIVPGAGKPLGPRRPPPAPPARQGGRAASCSQGLLFRRDKQWLQEHRPRGWRGRGRGGASWGNGSQPRLAGRPAGARAQTHQAHCCLPRLLRM